MLISPEGSSNFLWVKVKHHACVAFGSRPEADEPNLAEGHSSATCRRQRRHRDGHRTVPRHDDVRDLRVLNGSLFNHPFMARLLPGPRLGTAQIVALQMSAMSPLCATSGHQSRLSFNKGAGSRVGTRAVCPVFWDIDFGLAIPRPTWTRVLR